jgi:phosphoesterase RecJ-like protein
MNWQQLEPFLYEGEDILIMVHERPDGDAWGSGLGLGLVLEFLGYKPRLVRAYPFAGAYAWLPGQHLVRRIPKGELRIPRDSAVMLVDCGDLQRCEYFLGTKKALVNADHHISNPGFGVLNWVDPQAGATAQVICRLLFTEGVAISPEAATCFYTALVTDTGGFRFSSTGAETLAIASKLIEAGADLALIRQKLWENRPRAELTLLQEVVRRIDYLAENRGILCALPYEVLRAAGLYDTETDNALEILRSTEGMEAVALLKEISPGLIKASLRSKSSLDCAAFMAGLGGGGHVRAAGCTLQEPLEEAKKRIAGLLMAALSSD